MRSYEIGRVRVHVLDDVPHLWTAWDDGLILPAGPAPADRLALCADMGYGDDLWAMSLDHEIAHHWLAVLDGLPFSVSLRLVAAGQTADPETRAYIVAEEERVCRWQWQLDKAAPRPWDHLLVADYG